MEGGGLAYRQQSTRGVVAVMRTHAAYDNFFDVPKSYDDHYYVGRIVVIRQFRDRMKSVKMRSKSRTRHRNIDKEIG